MEWYIVITWTKRYFKKNLWINCNSSFNINIPSKAINNKRRFLLWTLYLTRAVIEIISQISIIPLAFIIGELIWDILTVKFEILNIILLIVFLIYLGVSVFFLFLASGKDENFFITVLIIFSILTAVQLFFIIFQTI
jgi:hypothetical protein